MTRNVSRECDTCRYEAIDRGSEIECGWSWCDYRKKYGPLLKTGACEHFKCRPRSTYQALYTLRDAGIGWDTVLKAARPVKFVADVLKKDGSFYDDVALATAREVVTQIKAARKAMEDVEKRKKGAA